MIAQFFSQIFFHFVKFSFLLFFPGEIARPEALSPCKQGLDNTVQPLPARCVIEEAYVDRSRRSSGGAPRSIAVDMLKAPLSRFHLSNQIFFPLC